MSSGISLILSIVAGGLLLLGFLGTFVPVLPGAPLAWAGLLAAYFSEYNDISFSYGTYYVRGFRPVCDDTRMPPTLLLSLFQRTS
jgi:uncharacterized protein YqgC (DUF456 family)